MLQELLPTLGRDVTKLEAWVFEGDAPASNRSIRDVYLEALKDSVLYIGLFWKEYGEWTIDEFEQATEWGIERHIYVKDVDAESRDSRLQNFLDSQSDVRFGITARWYKDLADLREQVTRSVEKWLLDRQIAYHSATSAVMAQLVDDIPNLPRKLIGREDLIAEAESLLDEGERVLLHGLAGIGKSAIAAKVAVQYINGNRGPVIWLKVGSTDAGALFEAIGRLFGEQQAIARQIGDERMQTVRHLLADTQALLVLDDVWNGNALAEFITATPRQMPMLVTSRQRFPLDEIIEINELQPNEALQLLNYHVRRRDFTRDPDARKLCKILGYHAYALEIAGKSLKVYDLAPGALLQRIEAAPHDLNMPANFGELGRTGIKALLDASVDALDRGLHDTFVYMGGMFEPSATPDLLSRILNIEESLVAGLLAQMEERGLVSSRTLNGLLYYQLHDLTYSYARTVFLNKGWPSAAVVTACRDYAADHRLDLDALDVELSNILEAGEAAHQSEQKQVLLDVMRSLAVDGPFFTARGHTNLSLRLMKTAIDISKDQQQIETAHYLLSRLGNTYMDFLGDLDSAHGAYQEALDLARALRNPQREAILLTVIGKVRFLQNAPDADHYYEEAEQIARNCDDKFAVGFALHHRGYQLLNKREPDYEKGWELSDEAATIAEQLELSDIHFHSLINRGAAEFELGRIEEALATHQQAHALASTHHNHPWLAYALQSIGEDYDRLQNQEQAQQAFDQALAIWRQTGGKAQAATLIEFMHAHQYTVQPEQV